MPSAEEETEPTEAAEQGPVDAAREALLEAISTELGDAVVGSHLVPGDDLWIRVATDAWTEAADYLRNRQRFRFFDFLSAIDWRQSPYGRSLEAAVDSNASAAEASASEAEIECTETGADGVTGGQTRFQVLARVYSLATHLGITLKADVSDDDLSIGTWTATFPGAAWHERETCEMFGINFIDNPDLRNLYLPTEFEGNPLRKDFPLLARLVKPWPGIVDVEQFPSTDNPEGNAP